MKLVQIDWFDSHAGEGWQSLGDLREANKPVRCRSVGWLVSEKNGHKTIVAHLSGGDGIAPYGRGDMTIPNTCITTMKMLRENSQPPDVVKGAAK